jgi:hypothetical protein
MEELTSKAYNKIVVPKFLIIENKRLGFALRVLQLTAFAVAIYIIAAQNSAGKRGYEAEASLSPYSTEIFLTPEYVEAPADVAHCKALDNYAGTTSPYNPKPQACKFIPVGETVEKTRDGIYVSTYNRDNYVTEDSTGRTEDEFAFFTPNPELQFLKLVHGYKVQTDEGGSMRFGRSTETEVLESLADGTTAPAPGSMVTYIETPDGQPCEVGGRNVWTQEHAKDGIGGSIQEWLDCAGFDLDADSPVGGAKKVVNRLTGADVYFDLFTSGPAPASPDYGSDVLMVTRIRVSAKAQYSTRSSVAYTKMHRPDIGEGTYRERTSRGLSFHVSTRGTYAYPSQAKLTTAIVNSIVILTMPNKIMMFVAMFALSLISEIYRECARERLNISNQFFGVVARYMNHVVNFRYMTKQGQTDLAKMKGMDYALFRKHMRAVFEEDLHHPETNPKGSLEEEEFTQITRILMYHLDKDNHKKNEQIIKEAKKARRSVDIRVEDGDIGMDEYITASGSNEVVQMRQIVKFFDDERKKSCMEKLFDDTVIEAPSKNQQVNRQATGALDFLTS